MDIHDRNPFTFTALRIVTTNVWQTSYHTIYQLGGGYARKYVYLCMEFEMVYIISLSYAHTFRSFDGEFVLFVHKQFSSFSPFHSLTSLACSSAYEPLHKQLMYTYFELCECVRLADIGVFFFK